MTLNKQLDFRLQLAVYEAVSHDTKIPIELSLYSLIKGLYTEIKLMKPSDGFSSPRDIALVSKVNAKVAILDKLQEAMQVINPQFDIKEQ